MLLRLHGAPSLGEKRYIFFLVSGKEFYGLSIFFFPFLFGPTEIKLDRKDLVKIPAKISDDA